MFISDLIQLLQDHMEEYGDCKVVVEENCYDSESFENIRLEHDCRKDINFGSHRCYDSHTCRLLFD